jgi:2-amino-4-hydroxy-6-hydroxymethyldihydropteridine diphosphokinase
MAEHVVFISVGSNINPEDNILRALDELAGRVRVEAVSTFYHTSPLDRPEQPPFVNGVVKARTDLEARALKRDVLRAIESSLGRVRTGDADAARTIDLDILLYDSAIINEPKLRVPDPDIRERLFLAISLLELAPDLVLPDTGERLAALACAQRHEGLIPAESFTAVMRERLGL